VADEDDHCGYHNLSNTNIMGYHATKPDTPTDYFVPLIVNGIEITDQNGICRQMFNRT